MRILPAGADRRVQIDIQPNDLSVFVAGFQLTTALAHYCLELLIGKGLPTNN